MSEFKMIETQEELDRIIGERLARQKEKYADYDQVTARVKELEAEIGAYKTAAEENNNTKSEYEKQLAGLQEQISKFESEKLRTRIGLANGLPYELVDRLQGADEASLKADAERLAGLLKPAKPSAPIRTNEPATGDPQKTAFQKLAQNLFSEGE